MENNIRDLILLGNTLNDIYHSLSVTKVEINNVFKAIDRSTLSKCGWDSPRIEIEKVLFSLHSKYCYHKNASFLCDDVVFDYVVFEDNSPILAIVYLGQNYIVCNNIPLCDEGLYNSEIILLNKKIEICKSRKIPLMIIPILEIYDNPYLSSDVRKAVEDGSYAEKHNKEAMKEYLDISAIYACSCDNYYEVKSSVVCGCYNCGAVVNASEIELIGQDYGMACPICKDFSIITDSEGFNITKEFMQKLKICCNETDNF